MDATALAVYVAASLALIATPGQDMLYVITRSLAQGRAAGVLSAVGVCLGILVHTGLAALGVGALLQASETLFLALKLGGAAYLVYLGLRMLLARRTGRAVDGTAEKFSGGALVWQGVLSNVTNPKMMLFFFAFLPQFVDPASERPTATLLQLGVLYAALALPIKAAVGIAAGSLGNRLLRREGAAAWLDRLGGAVLVGLGLQLATAGR